MLAGNLHQLLSAFFSGPTEIEMITYQVEKGLVANIIAGTQDGLPVSAGLRLNNEGQSFHQLASRLSKGIFRAGAEDYSDRVDTCFGDLLDDHFQGSFFDSISVD
jgi:hypothetical protein